MPYEYMNMYRAVGGHWAHAQRYYAPGLRFSECAGARTSPARSATGMSAQGMSTRKKTSHPHRLTRLASGRPAIAAPKYATSPIKPSEAPTFALPTNSAPQSPMSICGPYMPMPMRKTDHHCVDEAPTGVRAKSASAAASAARYAITTLMRIPTRPLLARPTNTSDSLSARRLPARPPSSSPVTRSAVAPASAARPVSRRKKMDHEVTPCRTT
mmetsp:Transcript_15076/g.38257  ORF Transcript_15076/g.38257 Transcript_15076/m.38257 type:complete len:213 (+) Transcript_15076:59-697(+)